MMCGITLNAKSTWKNWAGNIDGLSEYLNDELWTADSVTGNGSGSYTFSTWKAEEYLAHNWDILTEALEEFGMLEDDVTGEWYAITARNSALFIFV